MEKPFLYCTARHNEEIFRVNIIEHSSLSLKVEHLPCSTATSLRANRNRAQIIASVFIAEQHHCKIHNKRRFLKESNLIAYHSIKIKYASQVLHFSQIIYKEFEKKFQKYYTCQARIDLVFSNSNFVI